MSFIYPLFLVAGVALAIPVIIHLFNLRRYKTVEFPHVGFLKDIQFRSQKSSQLRYKWLLALRLLFLASLILAFAQPFFSGKEMLNTEERLQAIYIDNSGSMSLKKGAQPLLDIAKSAARKQVKQAAPGTKFVLLTNDQPVSYRPMAADKVLIEISNIGLSDKIKTATQVLSYLQSIQQSESIAGADLYCYTDLQQTAFALPPGSALLEHVQLYVVPLQPQDRLNIYIDTAYLSQPVLQIGENNQLVVRTKLFGKIPEQEPVLNLSVNGQVKSAATLNFNTASERIDTLSFRVSNAAWQQIELVVDDVATKFDDTFRLTARSAPNLSVLCLNEGIPSPYIQAAFRAYNGFRLQNTNINSSQQDWNEYSLVILNGCKSISKPLAERIKQAIQNGQTVCIFPSRVTDLSSINEGLSTIADIKLSFCDTAAETATSIQRGNALIKDLFEEIPDNVKLPATNWHYVVNAELSANQQSIISYRDGNPMFAQYSMQGGELYLSTTGIGLQDGDFPSSYFFAPFLYQMAIQSSGGNVYALNLGSNEPAYLPLTDAGERNMVHLITGNKDAIPPQRSQGAGLNVFVDEVVEKAGFYDLVTQQDTTTIAVNTNRAESQLDIIEPSALQQIWATEQINIVNAESIGITGGYNRWGSFPLWKVCVIFALIMLAAETWVLANSLRKPTAATE